MKKLVALLLSVIMVLSLAACGGKDTAKSDMEYIKEKGTLVVGITSFAPMDYKDANGKWIGFDADMATAFAEYLGVEVDFQEIIWDDKLIELEGKSIDCVWNGMTLVDEVLEGAKCSEPYCKNAQVVVVKKDVADKYTDKESLKDLDFVAEEGGAAEELIEANGWKCTGVQDQALALMEVAGGTADATVIDWLMAKATLGKDAFKDLTYTVKLNEEEYGVAFRKNSDLADELNKFFKEAYADESMITCAKKYEIDENIIPQE